MIECLIWFIIIVCIFLVVKNIRTYIVRSKIAMAICQWRIDHAVGSNYWLNTDLMEPYNRTLLRFWDWSYKRIVNKRAYEKIKDYIGKDE